MDEIRFGKMMKEAFSPDKHVCCERERQQMHDDFEDLDKKIKAHEENAVVLQAMNSISKENFTILSK
jgi:hypothetical protein